MKFVEYMGAMTGMRYTKMISEWDSVGLGLSFNVVSVINLNDYIIK